MMQNIQVSNTFLQGHRAELYAARVAKCLAAMEGREKVFVDDLKKAVKYMISVNSSHLLLDTNKPDTNYIFIFTSSIVHHCNPALM
jgi:Mg-chelatase subunit ChlI